MNLYYLPLKVWVKCLWWMLMFSERGNVFKCIRSIIKFKSVQVLSSFCTKVQCGQTKIAWQLAMRLNNKLSYWAAERENKTKRLRIRQEKIDLMVCNDQRGDDKKEGETDRCLIGNWRWNVRSLLQQEKSNRDSQSQHLHLRSMLSNPGHMHALMIS